ncbi:HpaII family restriction endonuclease [Psychrobacter celer]|uniref:HpaII family restriction endonuclease n=1 Tax=Psychrobacter celer TaxID=306572 RepID=UPI003FD4E270
MNLDLFATENEAQDYRSQNSDLKFIDLFAGIGGFHLALSNLGAECVFASEKDKFARQTYEENFDTANFEFNDDIRKISPDQIPDHDVLCAGFPCQPFSQAGLKKGFKDGEDSERGNLFYCILDILEAKKPKAFILENVRHLIKHDEGRTFDTIQNLLKKAGYRVHYQVLKASDYNIPQLRPRVFIVGFRGDEDLPPFVFPPKVPLTYTMSDVFEGDCDRDVGFTLRVGGKGSTIDDRRNYEFYRVDGEVRRIDIPEAKKIMALPDNYKFPVSKSQTMKQLGNSVCVEVVRKVAESVFEYLDVNSNSLKEKNMPVTRNKGELSEIYALLKVIYQEIIAYGDLSASATDDTIKVMKIHLDNSDIELKGVHCYVYDNADSPTLYNKSQIISEFELNDILSLIKKEKGTFSSGIIDDKVAFLGMDKSKGTSLEKSDMVLSFLEKGIENLNQGTSIKSFLGGSPTLLNASQATNFIYEIEGLDSQNIDEINNIETRSKVKDRISKIESLGGVLKFHKCENSTYESTLRKVDSKMPEILASALKSFFLKETSNRLSEYVSQHIADSNRQQEVDCRLKDFVKSTMLGIFPTRDWDGNLKATAVLLVNKDGDLVFYHTNKEATLKDFFYQQTFFDTPSTSRHRFGNVYRENDGKTYFKLNLQLRLSDKIF